NHEHRIDRWAPEGRVVARQLCVYPGKVQHSGDLAHLVIIRNDLFEAERIEKLPLVPVEPPHHRSPPQRIASERRNHRSRKPSTIFATKSAQMRPRATSAFAALLEQERTYPVSDVIAPCRHRGGSKISGVLSHRGFFTLHGL